MQVLGLCLDHWTWVFEVSIPTFSLSVSYHFGGESQIIYSEYLLESRIIFWLLTFWLTFFFVSIQCKDFTIIYIVNIDVRIEHLMT